MEPLPLLLIAVIVVATVVIYNRKVPRAPIVEKTRILYWYEDPTQTIAIRPYASAELATRAANFVAGYGWVVQSVSTTDGHVNVGRTVTGAVLTGGIALLAGGSRTQGSVTVTFTRAPVAVVA